MALSPGTRLGVYEVIASIGEGGMGQVYRATDTTLGRQVAIKLLPDAFASDPDRLARFEREAKTLASLNHPHIAAIYGFEKAGGLYALVMELVEGEDLSQRIARGAIPLDEALPIARQIADALEAAHDQGIVHRDLKPANIKVRPDGTVKVLDFGLAKAMDSTVGSSATTMNSPTLSIHATQAGMILGTAAYMAPEQARGKAVDRRADIWAFGVVLFEMLSGRRAFEGETIPDLLAKVIEREPDWSALPGATPTRLRELLRRSMRKDPKNRLRDIGEARVQIEELSGAAEGAGVLNIPHARSIWGRRVAWAVAAAALVLVAEAIAFRVPWRRPSPLALLRLSVELGADVALTVGAGDATSLSPDGAVIAFVAQKNGGGSPQIYVRRLTELHATLLSGTDEAESPFFSPDGQWIAFFANGKLRKIAASGGATVTLCDAPNGRGGAWSEDGTIVLSPDSTPGTRLMRVSSAGGTPEPVTSLAEGELSQRWPQVLPGGKAVLFTSGSPGVYDDASLVVQALPAGARTVVQRGGYHGRYLPTGLGSPERTGRNGGHLVYVHAGTVFTVPFDLDRLAVTGTAVPAFEGVATNAISGGAQFAASAGGTAVYLPGQRNVSGWPIHWMDHTGKTTPLRAAPANWVNLVFAPDGRRLAMQIADGAPNDIWVYEWARNTLTRLTSNPADDIKPVWSPNGLSLVFASSRADLSTLNLYAQRADGTGEAQRLTQSPNLQQPASWHPSGTLLAFEEQTPATSWDLMILPMAGDEVSGWKPGKPRVFLNSPFQEREPMFSPDGRWLAYGSDETGRPEVFVRPFPGPGSKWQISTDGAVTPTWSRTKRELLFATLNGQIMVAPYVAESASFRAEKPRLWSEGRHAVRGGRRFDLHPDGTRIAVTAVENTPGVKQDKVTFLFNFFDELRRIAPVAKR